MDDETRTNETENGTPEQEHSPREIALEQLLQELRESNANQRETIKELKIQNEKLTLMVSAGTDEQPLNDGDLFSIFDKYNKKKH